jgi:hypothetical protein
MLDLEGRRGAAGGCPCGRRLGRTATTGSASASAISPCASSVRLAEAVSTSRVPAAVCWLACLDVLQRAHHLLDAELLLVGRGHDLLEGLHAFLYPRSHLLDGADGGVRAVLAGGGALDRLFGQHHRGVDAALDLAEDAAHLRRRSLGLIGEQLHLGGDDGEAAPALARRRRFDGGV